MLENYKIDLNKEQYELSEIQNKKALYKKFVLSQEKGFLRVINYINSRINTLKAKAKISQFVEIRARIKDTESALNNYFKCRLLDDVFGIEIICANEEEIEIIKEDLENYFKSTRSKEHNKPNGYKAKHESYSVNINKNKSDPNIMQWNLCADDVPAIECQYKTISVELNPEASHHDYKKTNKNEIQHKLENEVLYIGKQIPRMWISRKDKMVELEYKEIIQKIYPFVDITTIKSPEEKTQIL